MHITSLSSTGGQIAQVNPSPAGDREFGSRSGQTNDLKNWYLWLPVLGFGINWLTS